MCFFHIDTITVPNEDRVTHRLGIQLRYNEVIKGAGDQGWIKTNTDKPGESRWHKLVSILKSRLLKSEVNK